MRLPLHLPLLITLAFSTASSVLAFPNLGKVFEPGQSDMIKQRLGGIPHTNLQNILEQLKDKVQELQANIPQHDLHDVPLTELTPQKIYDAFGIRRDGGLLPPGEDDKHPYIKPGPGDKRGPCPGLNTIANHGYIPRNGVVDPIQLLVGTFEGLNLSPDLAAILAIISFVGQGDLLQMKLSIGSRYGLGDGLNHHGILEGDASVTRQDNYFGNSWDAQPNLVTQFINETNTYGKGNVDIFSLAHSRRRAWDFSRENNPVFDFNPWRMLVAYAESGFVHEVLRGSYVNFNESMIRSWFLEERFPAGWSKRLIPFSTPEILAWAAVIELVDPTVPGWSVGKGAFIPIPTTDGLYKELQSFLDPKTTGATLGMFLCDAANAVLGFFPSQLTNLFGALGIPGVGATYKCA